MVSIIKCDKYDFELIKKYIRDSFDNLGGIEKYINKGEKVLLKVNLVMKKPPESAATSDPIFTGAIASVLSEYGAKVIIGDSPGGPFSPMLLKSIYSVCEMDKAAKLGNAELNYNTEHTICEFPDGKILKKITVGAYIKDCDKIISVCRLKTHCMTKMTGAVKNMFGTIPGTTKAEYHFYCPDVDNFANCLIDICLNAKPILSFMDAIIGMEGEGPTAGKPRKIGTILASENPFHMDYIASKIINASVDDIPILKNSIKRGLCPENIEDIQTIGYDYKDFIIEDYEIPKTKSMHFLGGKPPKFLEGFVDRHVQPRPNIDYKKCIGCGDCARNCPAKTIEMKNHKPIIDTSKCIRCYCCQELCPKEAVSVYRPHILRLMSKL